MQADRVSSQLPSPPRRRRRRDWGAAVAKLFCLLFAIIGVTPAVLSLVVRSAWARTWAVRETTRLLKEHGIVATYEVGVRLWPVALELRQLTVQSSDGGPPLLTSPLASVRPRFF